MAGDADDADDTVFPGAPEINDGKDNDQDGATDEDNSDPVADAETLEVAEDGTLAIPVATLLAGDTDADGDALTVTARLEPGERHGRLDDKGDGDPSNDEVIFTPTPGYSGTAIRLHRRRRLRRRGHCQGRNRGNGDIRHTACRAGDDAETTSEDVAVAIDVLDNDTDSDGGPKAVAGFSQGVERRGDRDRRRHAAPTRRTRTSTGPTASPTA